MVRKAGWLLAVMLAGGINRALHPGLSEQDLLTMMQ